MTYSDAVQFLYGLRLFGTKFGLDNTFKLAALAGNPQHRLRFIHVAGTNGKGSTCAMLESIYRAAGLRVGLFTSPHLISFAERIQVDRQLVSEVNVARLVADLRAILKEFPADEHPTFFEVVTVMALRYFTEQKCDLVIWETGMGGRLDATNIVTPLASVITNVQFDHQQWLGDALARIAYEKAGIIKRGVPLVTTAADPDALEVIRATAHTQHATLAIVTAAETQKPPLDTIELPLRGEHQRLNAALVLATVRAVEKEIPVGEEAIRAGLTNVRWSGRFQLIKRADQTFVLDGAHNLAGAEALRGAWQQYFGGQRPALVFGTLADKDWARMCEVLAPMSRRMLLVPVNNERTAPPTELVSPCQQSNPAVDVLPCNSLAQALDKLGAEPLVLITGSLYLVGEALQQLRASGETIANERGLNEWQVVPDRP